MIKIFSKILKILTIVQDPVNMESEPLISLPKITNLDECASHRYEELKQMMNKMRKESKK